MIYIGLVIFLAIVLAIGNAIIFFIPGEEVKVSYDGVETRKSNHLGFVRIGLFSVVAIIFVVLTLGSSIRQVGAGHVGLVYTFGDITGQREAGINLIFPWQGLKVTTVQTQKIRPETTCGNGTEECLEAFSAETQDVFIVPTINLKVSPTDIQQLFTEVGPDYLDKLVRPRIHQIFKDETVKFASTDLAPNREVIRARVLARLTAELSPFSITVEDLLIDNIDFPLGFKAAIEAKQVAEQQAQLEEEKVRGATAIAAQAVAIAQGEADANTILAASLETRGNFILQFRAIDKLAPNVKIIMLPVDSGIIPVLGESLLGSP